MNDGVRKSLSSLSYAGVPDVIEGCSGALLVNINIKSAYRHVPIHPDDRWLTGMIWDGALLIVPFGPRSAPKIFTALADAAEWILHKVGINFVIHFLNDVLIIGAPNSSECQSAMKIVVETFAKLALF